MKRCFLFVILLFVCVLAYQKNLMADTIKPFALRCESTDWWRTKNGWESFKWVDHTSTTNTSYRLVTNEAPTEVSTRRSVVSVSAFVDKDLNIISYTVRDVYVDRTNGYKYDINKVAPATYDLVNGKFYTEMTEDEKRSLWAAYTNKVVTADIARESRWTAPAKFDISKTPKEYLKELLKDRKWSELTPDEQSEIKDELKTYTSEWQRINDPKTYFGLEWHVRYEWFRDDETEQQKKARTENSSRRGRRRLQTSDMSLTAASSAERVSEMRAAERKAQDEHSKWCKAQLVDWDALD